MKYLLLSLCILTFQCHADSLLCTRVNGITSCTGTTDGSVHVSSSSCSDGPFGTTCTGDNVSENPGINGHNGGEFDRDNQ
jgi:hypothetical protein